MDVCHGGDNLGDDLWMFAMRDVIAGELVALHS